MIPQRTMPKTRGALPGWLEQWTFTRYVTLAFNDSMAGERRSVGSSQAGGFLRDRLRRWDAMINHQLLGKHWAKMSADRVFTFFFLEKPDSNPHWHGLVRFIADSPDELVRQEQTFDQAASPVWKKLVPAGSVDIQPVTGQLGVSRYITKSLDFGVGYEDFVIPDQLWRG